MGHCLHAAVTSVFSVVRFYAELFQRGLGRNFLADLRSFARKNENYLPLSYCAILYLANLVIAHGIIQCFSKCLAVLIYFVLSC